MWRDNLGHFLADFWPEKITSRDGCFLLRELRLENLHFTTESAQAVDPGESWQSPSLVVRQVRREDHLHRASGCATVLYF